MEKKYVFFKYYIKNRVFAGRGGDGSRKPVPLGGGLDVQFFTDMVWGRGRWMEAGMGAVMLKPAPVPPMLPCLPSSSSLSIHHTNLRPSTSSPWKEPSLSDTILHITIVPLAITDQTSSSPPLVKKKQLNKIWNITTMVEDPNRTAVAGD